MNAPASNPPLATTPRVSVVIPMHNAERYIGAALQSALDPSLHDVEVLVIDDGSTDKSVAVASAIDDPRVTVIQIPASGGPSRPRNMGIERARAPYVSLLDSDDLLKPNKLASSVAALDRCPSAGLAFGDFEKIDADGNVYELSVMYAYPMFRDLRTVAAGDDWRLIPQAALARGLLYENFIGTSGVVIRTTVAKAVGGFDESLPNSNDRDLWFRLAHACDALYSPHAGHSYRVHSASIVHGPPVRNAVSRITVLRRERARWTDRAARRQLDTLIAENLAAIGYHQRIQRKRWAAVRSYLNACAISPQRRWFTGLIAAALFASEREGFDA